MRETAGGIRANRRRRDLFVVRFGIGIDLADLQMPAIERQVSEADGLDAVALGIDHGLHRGVELRPFSTAGAQCPLCQVFDLVETEYPFLAAHRNASTMSCAPPVTVR